MMSPVNKQQPSKLEQFAINLDNGLEYIPFASAITSIAKATINCLSNKWTQNNHYFDYIKNKSGLRSVGIAIPGLNLAIKLYALGKKDKVEVKDSGEISRQIQFSKEFSKAKDNIQDLIKLGQGTVNIENKSLCFKEAELLFYEVTDKEEKTTAASDLGFYYYQLDGLVNTEKALYYFAKGLEVGGTKSKECREYLAASLHNDNNHKAFYDKYLADSTRETPIDKQDLQDFIKKTKHKDSNQIQFNKKFSEEEGNIQKLIELGQNTVNIENKSRCYEAAELLFDKVTDKEEKTTAAYNLGYYYSQVAQPVNTEKALYYFAKGLEAGGTQRKTHCRDTLAAILHNDNNHKAFYDKYLADSTRETLIDKHDLQDFIEKTQFNKKFSEGEGNIQKLIELGQNTVNIENKSRCYEAAELLFDKVTDKEEKTTAAYALGYHYYIVRTKPANTEKALYYFAKGLEAGGTQEKTRCRDTLAAFLYNDNNHKAFYHKYFADSTRETPIDKHDLQDFIEKTKPKR